MHKKFVLALAIAAISAVAAGAQVVTLRKPAELVQWEAPDSVAPWYANQALESELRSAVDTFFGNSVGAYSTNSVDMSSERFAENAKWQLISSQFFPPEGDKVDPVRGSILDGEFTLYAYYVDSIPVTMFVIPRDGGNVVAAAMVHGDCPPIAARDLPDAAAVKKHFDSPGCMQSALSIFFRNRASMNPQIRDVLMDVGVYRLLRECKHDILHNPATSVHREWIAKYGSIPPCRVNWHVVFVDSRLR